nr:reverse transcriptase domain-containing protein [Tanacetum cinerariifolium]
MLGFKSHHKESDADAVNERVNVTNTLGAYFRQQISMDDWAKIHMVTRKPPNGQDLLPSPLRNDLAIDHGDRYHDDPIPSMGLKIENPEFTGKTRERVNNAPLCYKCSGLGHYARDYLNMKTLAFVPIDADPINDTYAEPDLDKPGDELVYPDRGEALVIQRLLNVVDSKSVDDNLWLRNNIFITKCTFKRKICDMIINGGNCENVVSTYMVEKLGMKIEDHLEPYQLNWLKKGTLLKSVNVVLFYWKTKYDEFQKTYYFKKDDVNITLVPFDSHQTQAAAIATRTVPPTAPKATTTITLAAGNAREPVNNAPFCYKCSGFGHYARDYLNMKTLAFIPDDADPIYDTDAEPDLDEPGDELVYPDHGEALVIQRLINVIDSKSVDDNSRLRNNIFRTKYTFKRKIYDMIINEGSCENVVSTYMVEKFGMKIEDHLDPYQLT